MLVTKEYNRIRARLYAEKWAFARNPLFENYAGIGGDCTNFISQAVYAGSCVMNDTPVFGWYYVSGRERTASWTGVEFFYNFITSNTGEGPFATEVTDDALEIGDIIQIGREDEGYYHTLLVTGFAENDYLVAAHTNDAFDRPLSTYEYDFARFLHIGGVRLFVPDYEDCYDALLAGEAIIRNDMI